MQLHRKLLSDPKMQSKPVLPQERTLKVSSPQNHLSLRDISCQDVTAEVRASRVEGSNAAGQLIPLLPSPIALVTSTPPQFAPSPRHQLCKWWQFPMNGGSSSWNEDGQEAKIKKWRKRLRRGSQPALKWFNLSDEELTLISLHFNNEYYDRFRGPVPKK